MSIKKIARILCFISFVCSCAISYSQPQSKLDLTSPYKSFEVLSQALFNKDTAKILKVVTEDGYNDILSKGLFLYGNKWLEIIKAKQVRIFHKSQRLQILKLDKDDYLLSFSRQEGAKEWKFNAFITKP